MEGGVRRHVEPAGPHKHAVKAEGEWASLTMPSAVLDAFVRAVRERDEKCGQAAQSPMVRRDWSRVKAPVYTPNQLKTW